MLSYRNPVVYYLTEYGFILKEKHWPFTPFTWLQCQVSHEFWRQHCFYIVCKRWLYIGILGLVGGRMNCTDALTSVLTVTGFFPYRECFIVSWKKTHNSLPNGLAQVLPTTQLCSRRQGISHIQHYHCCSVPLIISLDAKFTLYLKKN